MSSTSNMTWFIDFTTQYNRFIPPIVLVFGVIGNILSLITFTSPVLRKNPCGTYFFGLAITHLNNLLFGILLNYLIDAHHIDLITAILAFCRLRFLILHCSLTLSSWFIVLAGIDRYCISCRDVHRRAFSSLRNARRLVSLAVTICFIFYAHILILFTISQTPSGPVCYAQSGAYRVFYDFMFFATFSFTPPILMIIVGLATLHNILQRGNQIGPVSITNTTSGPKNNNRLRKKDRQFLKMLLIQSIFTIFLTLPIAVQKLYVTFTQNIPKSSDRLLVENFFASFVRTLTGVNSAASFYLYTVSGSVFRHELGAYISKFIGLVFGVDNRFYRRFQQMI